MYRIYLRGEGVKPNEQEAVMWLKDLANTPLNIRNSKAKNTIILNAIYNLGARFETGRGVSKNYHLAKSLYNKAIKINDPTARYKLAMLYINKLESPDSAYQHLAQAANSDHLLAQGALGQYNLERGHLYDAFKWHLKAAQGGLASSQYAVGRLYLTGKGTEKDRSYKGLKAAKQGHAEAQNELANFIFQKTLFREP